MKPQNVLVCGLGNAGNAGNAGESAGAADVVCKLCDFGISSIAAAADLHTARTLTIGQVPCSGSWLWQLTPAAHAHSC